MSLPSMNTVITLVSKVGFPIVAFLLIFYACREVVVWSGTEVIKPAIRAHVDLVGSLQEAVKENTEISRQNAATNAATAASVQQISEVQQEQTAILREMHKGNGG